MKHTTYIACLCIVLLASCSKDQKISTSSPEALKSYIEGVRLLQNFYYPDAQKALEHALELDPSFAMASARLAVLYSRTGSEAQAKAEIAKAVQLSAGATRREKMIIKLLDDLINFRNVEAGTLADSIIQLYPREAEAYVWRGDLYELAKDYDASLAMYTKAVEADSTYPQAQMSIGYAYSGRGDFDKAIDAMQRYIRLAPDVADPRASFADILFRSGRYDEALDQYRKSLELKPDYWYSINRIGDVYVVLGRLNDAEKQFDEGMSKMVMNNEVRATHVATEGYLQFFRGKYEDAIRLCDQSLALDSTNGRAAYIRALSSARLKKFGEVGETFKAIEREIERKNLAGSEAMLEFHLLRARCFDIEDRLEDALAECDSAMDYGSDLNRSEVYRQIAEVRLKQGNTDAALDALEGAFRYNSNNPMALLTLTRVYQKTRDRQMTNEIGGRLFEIWKDADKDFQPYVELKKLVAKSPSQSAASS